MDEQDRKLSRAVLEACKKARARLHGSGNAKQKLGAAKLCFSAYEHASALGALVRDFRNARSLGVAESVLDTLERTARSFAEDD